VTPEPSEVVAKGKTGGLRWFIDSMVGFWFLLLVVSLGLAAAIYYVWLRGRV
jgi:hypothetical protein